MWTDVTYIVNSLTECFCHFLRKHHCPIHPVPTNTLAMDQKLKLAYNPKSDYDETFTPRQFQPVERRGLAVPARILPGAPPTHSMDFLTMTHQDFVQKPLSYVQKATAKNHLQTPRAPFQDSTSYKSHYPMRAFDPNATAKPLMHTTMPRIIEVLPNENYLTTNQCTLRKWSGKNQSIGYKELQEPPFFAGKFQNQTVSADNFSSSAIEGGRPGTNCKKVSRHLPDGGLDGRTTHKMAYKLPTLTERGPVHLKGHSQVMEETMDQQTGKMESLTQYQRDNPGFYFKTSRRCLSPPHLEKLELFKGRLDDKSQHKASFKILKELSRSFPSIKDSYPGRRGDRNDRTLSKSFTTPNVIFKNKNKQHDKDSVLHKTELWDPTPQVHHSDNSERVYHPSKTRFVAESETTASFPAVQAKASEACQPLDVRFGRKGNKSKNTFTEETSYKIDYKPRPLRKPDICPAKAMLQKA